MHPTSPPKPLRAYGDRDGDGMVQMSFVLPMPPSVPEMIHHYTLNRLLKSRWRWGG